MAEIPAVPFTLTPDFPRLVALAINALKSSSGAGLADPNADRILFWDDSAGALAYLTPGTNLTIVGTTINAASGGGVTDGDKGDITVSGTGATWTVDAGAVTLAKMSDMATASLIYRKTAGAGAPEVNTLVTLKADLGLTGTNSGDQTTVTGNAGTATALATPRNISITGKATAAGGTFDGSAALALNITAVTLVAGDIPNIAQSQVTNLVTDLGNKQPLDTQLTDIAALVYTANAGKVIQVNAGATAFELATPSGGGVPTTRLISTTAPLAGGGDLSADRTLTISAATTGAAGSMSAADKARLDAAFTRYHSLLDCSGSHIAGRVAGTYGMGQGDALAITAGTGTLYPLNTIYIAAADYPAAGTLNPKLRIRVGLYANDIAPTGNFTIGLHPVTRPAVGGGSSAGGAGVNIYTIGAAVASSTVTITAPAAGSANVAVTAADFALPADGHYVIGVVTTATVAASSHLHISALLQMRYA